MSLRQDLEERSSTNKPGEYAFQRAKVENQLILTLPPGWSSARSVYLQMRLYGVDSGCSHRLPVAEG